MEVGLNDFQLRIIIKSLQEYISNLENDLSSIESNNEQSEDCNSFSTVGNSSLNLLKTTMDESKRLIDLLTK